MPLPAQDGRSTKTASLDPSKMNRIISSGLQRLILRFPLFVIKWHFKFQVG